MRASLLVRALIGLWFGARIAAAASWMQSTDVMIGYLQVDGALAIIVAGFFLREAIRRSAVREEMLALVLFVDGAGRVVSGAAARYWPGLLEFPVTLVVFLGVMALCTAAVGLVEGTLVAEEEVARHGRWHSRPQFAAGPVGTASILSIAFGIAAMLSVGDVELMRRLIAGQALAVTAVMAGLAWPRQRSRIGITATRRSAGP